MSKETRDAGDGIADAITATAVITIVVAATAFWLSGFPA
jgi:hypothetical protein